VLEAFIARAALAHATTNCLTEILFDTARVKARELDEEFKKTGKPVGLLHGVPLSLKDQYEVVGYDATVGFTQWVGKPSSSNAEVSLP
jgi:Asp-tRNA(Asn)/Glu-tRNA(Gln) amidotransferase A subunit family amidase